MTWLITAGRGLRRYAGVVPFGVYMALGLLAPLIAVVVGAFQNAGTGAFTFANVKIASHGIYLHGFGQTILLAVLTSIAPGILGLLIAYAIWSARRGSVLRQVSVTASAVFANFGGVPLAFLFIATLGSSGLASRWLTDLGFNPYQHGFSLYSLSGVIVVYLYFQIPLMVLIILPALEGLRPAWREAAANMGARTWQYWRHVGGPVLLRGAGWPSTLWRIILPNLTTALLSATVLTVALVLVLVLVLVLGEYTMASLDLYQTFPVWIVVFDQTSGPESVAASLLALFVTWLFLLVITLLGRRQARRAGRGEVNLFSVARRDPGGTS